MPVVTIPNKICSHCGGIEWLTSKDKRIKSGIAYICHVRKQEYHKKFKERHPDNAKVKSIEYRNKVKHTEYYLTKTRERSRKWYEKNKKEAKEYNRLYIKQLTDNYVKQLIIARTPLTITDIPQELIDLKRKELILTRQFKTQQND